MTSWFARKLHELVPLLSADMDAIDAATSRVRRYVARQDLIREGDKPGPIFVILEGWANNPLIGGYPTSITDPYGHAALILVESLMHGLIERSVLTSAEAVDVVETAVAVHADLASVAADGAAPVVWRSHALLSDIETSLRQQR